MSLEIRRPKEHIEDVRDRFMDFVGNPWNGVLGAYDNLNEEGFSEDGKSRSRESLRGSWTRFFENIDIFLQNDFSPTGGITRENLQEILKHRNDDPFDDGVIARIDELYIIATKQ